jgi:hypothetical protein
VAGVSAMARDRDHKLESWRHARNVQPGEAAAGVPSSEQLRALHPNVPRGTQS